MDDCMKIKVLMIYYDHWGAQEIRARKAVDGINKTISLLKDRFQTEEHSLEHGMKRFFHYMCDDEAHFVCTEFVDIFLEDCGGCFEPIWTGDPYDYDEEEMIFDRKILLEDHLNIVNDETADIIYDQDFGHDDALSVEAIVALF